MTRDYTFRERMPKEFNPVVSIYPATEVERLVQYFQEEVKENSHLLVDAYMSLVPLDLHDLLIAELQEAPTSPISQEMRRRVMLFARERAELAAEQILKGD